MIDKRDVLRSLVARLQVGVAPLDVVVPTIEESTSSKPAWFDGYLMSFEPFEAQRNADYVVRGTFRIRGFWRVGPGKLTPTYDDPAELAQRAENAFRGQNVAVMDFATGTGATQVGVASFSEVPFQVLDPLDGVGTILAYAEFLLS